VWRILTSERFSATSPNQILGDWSMEDLMDAHLLLDMYEELENKASK